MLYPAKSVRGLPSSLVVGGVQDSVRVPLAPGRAVRFSGGDGATVSTRMLTVNEALRLPAVSMATALRVCGPSPMACGAR